MKIYTAVLSLLLFSTAAAAQNPDPSKWTCRNLSDSGGFVNPGETIFGTLACRPVSQTSPAPAQPSTPPTAPAPAPPAQSSTPPAQAAPDAASDSDSPATVYFYRAKRFQGSALKPSVFVDDAPVGNLHNGDSLKFTVKPGKHRIYSTDKSTGIDLEVKPGETYYVRVDILVGFWKGHGGVTLVDPQQGKYELGQVAH
jgi:Protein of unknown function (DUF2846)